jgi:hypothetical protein
MSTNGYDDYYKSLSYSRLNCLLEHNRIDKKTYDEELEFVRVSSPASIDFRFWTKDWEILFEELKEETDIEYETSDMVREDAIECPVCLETRWGVRLPNCSHFICAKCYYTIYKGFIPEKFKQCCLQPIEPEAPPNRRIPEYPYTYNKEELESIFDSFEIKSDFRGWFINENKDLYISIKRNTEYVEDVENVIKEWFKNDKKIKLYKQSIKSYKDSKEEYDKLWSNYCKEYDKYLKELEEYNEYLEYEEEWNSKKKCPLCRK